MARNSASDVSEAFEMFLDTISNAFGGIIFISLLVCIMLQMSQKVSKPPDPQASKAIEEQVAAVQQQIDQLLKLKEEQVSQVNQLGSRFDPELLERYRRLLKQERDLQVVYNDLVAAINALQFGTADLTKKLLSMEADRTKLLEKIEELRKKGVPEEGAPPVAGVSRKKQVGVFLRNGKLVFFMKYNDRGEPVGGNAEEVSIREAAEGKFAAPKAGAGVLVENTQEGLRKLAEAFDRFSPVSAAGAPDTASHCVSIVVWPDSYSQCEVLRDLLIRKKFEYGLSLLTEDQGVPIAKGVGTTVTFHR